MKLSELFNRIDESSLENTLKRVVHDTLISLKINGVKEVKLDQIINDFNKSGVEIGEAELLNLLNADPLVKSATLDKVVFSQDLPDSPKVNPEKQKEKNDRTLDQMSKSALDI